LALVSINCGDIILVYSASWERVEALTHGKGLKGEEQQDKDRNRLKIWAGKWRRQRCRGEVEVRCDIGRDEAETREVAMAQE